MLFSGVFWAFVIGHLVSIVQHMQRYHDEYKIRMDRANDMMKDFSLSPDTSSPNNNIGFGVGNPEPVMFRIRRFITVQHDKSKYRHMGCGNSATLDESYPVLGDLSLELRKLSSLHLLRKYFEMVPYLSSKYLSPEVQSNLAFKCILMDFAKGESFQKHPQHGRGIMFHTKGFCIANKNVKGKLCSRLQRVDEPIGLNETLVEDKYMGNELTSYHFASYSKVIFIPRTAILEAINTNQSVWKECARWRYLEACLEIWSMKERRGFC